MRSPWTATLPRSQRVTRRIGAQLVGQLLLASGMLLAACSPPAVERPLEGAPAGSAGGSQHQAEQSGPPPTLAPAVVPGSSPSPAAGPVGSPSPSPSPVLTHVIGATDGAGANVRSSPSTSAPVVVTLREGTLVEPVGEPVSAEGRSWRRIRTADRDGWVVSVVVRPR